MLQETLIVWSEGDNCDYALSFQEKKGCDEVWEKICQVFILVLIIKCSESDPGAEPNYIEFAFLWTMIHCCVVPGSLSLHCTIGLLSTTNLINFIST